MLHVESRQVAVSRFREDAGKWLDWVAKQGGHVWLTRHGKHVAALIPFYQLEVLEEVLGQSETQKAEAMERAYTRFRSAKAKQVARELARLNAGLENGSAHVSRRQVEMLQRGANPWEEDPVLIRPGYRKVFKAEKG